MNNIDFSQSGGQKITNTTTMTLLQQATVDAIYVLLSMINQAPLPLMVFGCNVVDEGSSWIMNKGVIVLNGEPFKVAVYPLTKTGGPLYYQIVDTFASVDPVTFKDGTLHSVHHIRKVQLFQGFPSRGINTTYFLVSGVPTFQQVMIDSLNGGPGEAPNAWINVSLANSWQSAAAETIAYVQEMSLLGSSFLGKVSLQGAVKNASTTPNITIGTLPVGSRPKNVKYFMCPYFDGLTTAPAIIRIAIDAAGNIILDSNAQYVTSNAKIYLDAISFYAEQ